MKVIKCFGLENCRGKAQPLPSGYKPSLNTKTATPTLLSHYQLVIGSLLYIMLRTRPHLAYSMIKMSQFSTNPSEEHLQKALHIVHYLSTTTELCIQYSPHGPETGLLAYCDMDYAGDKETLQSTTGYSLFLANGIVSWLSRQQ